MAKKSTDELVAEALLKLATAASPLRLRGKGDPPSLFEKSNKPAIAALQDESNPLVAVVGSGKAATVRLTAAGFQRVLPQLPAEKVGTAARELAAGLPAAKRVEFLNEVIGRTPEAATDLLALLDAAVMAEKAEGEARVVEAEHRRRKEAEVLQAVEQWKALVASRRQQRVAFLRRELEAEGETVASALEREPRPIAPRTPSPALRPETAEDVAFRRQIARRLVSAWIDAWDDPKPESRQFLETAIWNVTGFRQVGEPNETVTFDGELHEGPAGCFPGKPAKVIRPGWVLEEDDREYVVAKAVVAS